MYLEKTIKRFNKSKRYRLSNFAGVDMQSQIHTLPRDYADECYNFTCEKAKLVAGEECHKVFMNENAENQALHIPTTLPISRFYVHSYYKDGAMANDLFCQADGMNVILKKLHFDSPWLVTSVEAETPIKGVSIAYKSAIYFLISVADDKMMYCYNYNFFPINNTPSVAELCVHNNRCFAVASDNGLRVRFTSAYDPTNWAVGLESGGYLDIPLDGGCIVKMISFLGNLFIFSEYGVWRLTANADQRDFALNKLFVSSGKIDGGSVAEVGDKIVFMASDGIYAFDGYSAVRVYENLAPICAYKTGNNAKSVGFNGKYYCIFKSAVPTGENFEDDGFVNDTLLSIDFKTKEVNLLKGRNFWDLKALKSNVYDGVIVLERYGELAQFKAIRKGVTTADNAKKRYWRCNNINFNNAEKKKVVHKVFVDTDEEIVFGIVADGVEYEYVFDAEHREREMCVSAFSFDFYIKNTTLNPKVGDIYLDVTETEEKLWK